MSRYLRVLGVAGALAGALPGCGDAGERGHTHGDREDQLAAVGGAPRVVASIHPVADLASQVLGDAGTVATLVPPGVSEHAAELTPEAMRALHDAAVLVDVGLGVDPAAQRAAAQKPGLVVLRFSEMVGAGSHEHDHDHAHHGEHGEAEPQAAGHAHAAASAHLWLDPAVTQRFVVELGERLGQLYPDHAAAFRANAERVAAEIGAIDAEYAPQLRAAPTKELVTFHNAFDLLAEHYGLDVVAHLTELDLGGSGEVAPGALAEAIRAVREHGLRVIYAEPQFPEGAMEAIKRETGVEVLRLDPLGNPEIAERDTYQELLRYNLDTLLEGQGRR